MIGCKGTRTGLMDLTPAEILSLCRINNSIDLVGLSTSLHFLIQKGQKDKARSIIQLFEKLFPQKKERLGPHLRFLHELNNRFLKRVYARKI